MGNRINGNWGNGEKKVGKRRCGEQEKWGRNMWITICFMIWLGTLGLLDLCYRKVPIWLMAVGTVAAVGFALCRYLAGAGGWEGLERIQRLPYDLAPGGILLAVSMITGKTGLADGIVLLATGLFLEPGSGFAVFSLSLFILALFSVALLLMGKAGRNTKVPYLPFLWLACVIQMVWL